MWTIKEMDKKEVFMKQFRLPRKIKKSLKKGLWLYPPDEKGNSLMASPAKSQEDFMAVKKGIARNLFDLKESKSRRKKLQKQLDKEVIVPDEELRNYVHEIIREDIRNSSYNKLIEAKNNPKAIVAYYNFVNAYHLYKQGDSSFGNICCLAVDKAKELLNNKKKL